MRFVAGKVVHWEAHRGSKIGKIIGKQVRRLFQKIAAI